MAAWKVENFSFLLRVCHKNVLCLPKLIEGPPSNVSLSIYSQESTRERMYKDNDLTYEINQSIVYTPV